MTQIKRLAPRTDEGRGTITTLSEPKHWNMLNHMRTKDVLQLIERAYNAAINGEAFTVKKNEKGAGLYFIPADLSKAA